MKRKDWPRIRVKIGEEVEFIDKRRVPDRVTKRIAQVRRGPNGAISIWYETIGSLPRLHITSQKKWMEWRKLAAWRRRTREERRRGEDLARPGIDYHLFFGRTVA